MYHNSTSLYKKIVEEGGKTEQFSSPYSFQMKLLAFLCVFALLVSDSAAGLASGLARGLALATATVLCTVAKVTSIQCLDVFHYRVLRSDFYQMLVYHILFSKSIFFDKYSYRFLLP